MKIIIGMDQSPHSWAALEAVKRMKWPEKTRLVVLTVAQPVYAMSEYGTGSWAQEAQEQELRAHEDLAARAEAELRNAGFETTALVRHGDPREALVDAARLDGADLLVVGSHGRSGIGKLVMGSVATHVVTHAPCNVLVVKIPRL